MTIYLVLAGLGILFLLLGLLHDFDFEIGGLDFSTIGVSSALVFAGVTGIVLNNVSALTGIAIVIISFGMMIVGFWLGMKLVKALIRNDSNSIGYDIVGMTGVLTALTGPKSGEVKIDDPREVETRMAIADEFIERGTQVEIVSTDGVYVKVKELANYEYRSY